MADKKYGKNTSINFTADDEMRLRWLRRHFGGIGQGAVVTMALKRLYAQERAPQRKLEPNKEGQAQIAPDAAP